MRIANLRLSVAVALMTISSIFCSRAVESTTSVWILSVVIMSACSYFMVYSLDEFLSDAD